VTNELWWYTARASGLVSWALLSASMLWGLVLSTKLRPPRIRPNWTLDLHRYLGGLAVIFVGVHLAALVFDSYVGFVLAELLVPFASHWKPTAVAWGVVGLYLLLAVEVSSLARKHLPNRIWRRLHFLAFPLYVVATLHMVTAGTDGQMVLALLAVAGFGVAIGALVAVRWGKMAPVVTPEPRPSRSERERVSALR
jgi:DMSO/TMAO reductase YedYZ heme-binding membrane subunit